MDEKGERLHDDEIVAHALGGLDAAERARVEARLHASEADRLLLAEYRAVAELLPHGLPRQEPPPDAREQLLVLARASAAQSPPAPAPQPPPDSRIRAPSRPRASAWRGAAVFALLIGLLSWNVLLQTGVVGPVAGVERLAAQPGGRTALMVNTGAAPGATGRVYLDGDGRRGVMTVAGLPVPPAGMEYQFWFARADKSRDSAAVFRVNDKGEALIPLTVPDTPGRYTEVWITREPAGGSRVPTAPHYLEGPIPPA